MLGWGGEDLPEGKKRWEGEADEERCSGPEEVEREPQVGDEDGEAEHDEEKDGGESQEARPVLVEGALGVLEKEVVAREAEREEDDGEYRDHVNEVQ